MVLTSACLILWLKILILILIMTSENFLNSIADFTWLTIIYLGSCVKERESHSCVTKDSDRVYEIRKTRR